MAGRDGIGIETHAVDLDLQEEARVALLERDGDARGPAVPHGVRDGLSRDAVHGGTDREWGSGGEIAPKLDHRLPIQ
jgi:hypothetical protein